jgi:putative flippase GtrA
MRFSIQSSKQQLTNRFLAHKELRYIVSGGASEVIEYASFLGLFWLTHRLIISNSISFIAGIASGFMFHKLWSFAGSQSLRLEHQIVRYSLLAGFNFIATNVLISLLVHHLQLNPDIAKLCTMALTATWSFVFFNKVIFRRRA